MTTIIFTPDSIHPKRILRSAQVPYRFNHEGRINVRGFAETKPPFHLRSTNLIPIQQLHPPMSIRIPPKKSTTLLVNFIVHALRQNTRLQDVGWHSLKDRLCESQTTGEGEVASFPHTQMLVNLIYDELEGLPSDTLMKNRHP